jgi:hypothetical protein
MNNFREKVVREIKGICALERAKTTRTRVVEPIAMTHVLPPHPQLDIRSSESPSSIHQMDQQPPIDAQQSQQSPTQPPPSQSRKRKKAENGEPTTPAEPRRLRRSHEACARCRSKKIKVGPISRNSSSLGPLARRGKSRRSTPSAIPWPLLLEFLSQALLLTILSSL